MNRSAGALAVASLAVPLAFAWTDPAAAEEGSSKRARIEEPDGTTVTFMSTNDDAMEIFLARGDVPGGAQPDPFERLGRAPLTIKLAPGVYTVEAESPTSSTGHERVFVEQGTPVQVRVRGGNATVKATGTVLVGLGVVAVVLGIVAIVSISPNDQHYDRFGIGIPLAVGGAAGAGIGWALTALGTTNIQSPHSPPGGLPTRSAPSAMGGSLVLRF